MKTSSTAKTINHHQRQTMVNHSNHNQVQSTYFPYWDFNLLVNISLLNNSAKNITSISFKSKNSSSKNYNNTKKSKIKSLKSAPPPNHLSNFLMQAKTSPMNLSYNSSRKKSKKTHAPFSSTSPPPTIKPFNSPKP